jgi:plastocyanin
MATARNVAGCLARRVSLAGVLVLLACGCTATPPASIPPAPPPVTVTLEASQFVVPPGGMYLEGVPTLTVPVGTTVTWTNNDPIDHTATEYLDGFAKPDARFDLELAPDESGSYTFTEAGTYEVGCVPHPAMQMLVIVE